MVRNGINDAEEVLHAGITNEPARDVSDRDDDRLRCAAGRGACDGGVNSPGDWKQLQEPPAEQLDSYRADAHGKNIERARWRANANALRLYGGANNDHCYGTALPARPRPTIPGRHCLLPT